MRERHLRKGEKMRKSILFVALISFCLSGCFGTEQELARRKRTVKRLEELQRRFDYPVEDPGRMLKRG